MIGTICVIYPKFSMPLLRIFIFIPLLLFRVVAADQVILLPHIKPAETLLDTEENDRIVIEKKLSRPVESYSHIFNGEKIIETSMHPFIECIHQAFIGHRPIVISPDDIWLLIIQGFTEHISKMPEFYRKKLVNHQGTMKLSVRDDSLIKGQQNPWDSVVEQLCQKIKHHSDPNFHDIFTKSFSTTQLENSVAFQVCLMDVMNPYFSYEAITFCGIPKIILKGTPKDWLSLINRTKKLETFHLSWWVQHIIPVLEKIQSSSKGTSHDTFWRSLYKYNESSGGTFITGWIIKFFPYLHSGKKNSTDATRVEKSCLRMFCVAFLYSRRRSSKSSTETGE